MAKGKSKGFTTPRSKSERSVLVKVKLPDGEREVRVVVKSNHDN